VFEPSFFMRAKQKGNTEREEKKGWRSSDHTQAQQQQQAQSIPRVID
jgi:hypothetical protein